MTSHEVTRLVESRVVRGWNCVENSAAASWTVGLARFSKMNENAERIQSLAEVMVGPEGLEGFLPVLNAVAASPSSCLVLTQSIADRLALRDGTIEQGLVAAMTLFEAINPVLGENSLFLMASLWGIAARLDGLHDVCDAIDLWIATKMTPGLGSYLLELSRAHSDEIVSSHYAQLAELR